MKWGGLEGVEGHWVVRIGRQGEVSPRGWLPRERKQKWRMRMVQQQQQQQAHRVLSWAQWLALGPLTPPPPTPPAPHPVVVVEGQKRGPWRRS